MSKKALTFLDLFLGLGTSIQSGRYPSVLV